MHIPPSSLPVTEGAGETFRVAPSFTSQEGFTSTGLHAEFFIIPTCLTLRVSSKLHFETLHHLFPARPRPLLVSVPAIPNKPTSRWVLDARSGVGMNERDQPRLWARRDMHQGHGNSVSDRRNTRSDHPFSPLPISPTATHSHVCLHRQENCYRTRVSGIGVVEF